MGKTNIEWADFTFNPWEGCTKVSPGCKNCYAETRNRRFGNDNWGPGKLRRRTSAANWKLPLKWNKSKAVCDHCGMLWPSIPFACCGTFEFHRPRVFCASIADWLDDEAPIGWMADLLKLIHDTPNLNWLLLSKRPENWSSRLFAAQSLVVCDGFIRAWLDGKAPDNVWFGVSVEDQKRADERIPILLRIPARVRFLSVEPMIEAIDLALPKTDRLPPSIAWTIFGGESGPGARPCNIEWIRDGIRQCRAAGVKTFCKQLGSRPVCQCSVAVESYSSNCVEHFPLAIRDKKGSDMNQFPEDLRVREFPNQL